MRKQLGVTVPELLIVFYILLIPAGIFGWVWNIVKMVAVCCDPLTGMVVLRIAGIFVPPLGAVVGYL
jgi:hypothetical protein